MGQLVARKSLPCFLLFFCGYHDLQGGNVKSQACLPGHSDVVRMPPSARDGALSSAAFVCRWAPFSH